MLACESAAEWRTWLEANHDRSPGVWLLIAKKDSAKHPSMHKTNSIDYLVVISGEMWMVMEEGEVLLRQGDCIVQRGTNHAWVNKSGKPCVIAAILIDAVPAP